MKEGRKVREGDMQKTRKQESKEAQRTDVVLEAGQLFYASRELCFREKMLTAEARTFCAEPLRSSSKKQTIRTI